MKNLSQTHHRAIELRYEGKTYLQISEEIENKLTEGTLKNHFAKGGILYIAYQEYAKRMSDARAEESLNIFRKEVSNASKAIVTILARALKSEDGRLALEAANNVLDRAGIIIPKKIESGDVGKLKELKDDELVDELKQRGFDPDEDPSEGSKTTGEIQKVQA